MVMLAIPECRLPIRSQASVRTPCWAASQDSHPAASGKSSTSTMRPSSSLLPAATLSADEAGGGPSPDACPDR
jgi:hypothetical protein